ncbi:ubiquinone biosynthesis monooxygenase COQ6, mitochondrial-like isoform X2 [Centruroides sculpturatus]|nr:ubiquinone biosynthesis monooxygenase COQ6, mitochondrial-like isoform X2 [Centruroides sculpturatus]
MAASMRLNTRSLSRLKLYLKRNKFSGILRFLTTESREDTESEWDMVISGGGLVGCAMACSIGHEKMFSEKKTLLLESSPPLTFASLTEKYSNRVFALTPGTRSLFERFNAWEIIKNLRYKEVKRLQVWENCSDAAIAFQHPEFRLDVAYVVENDVILRALHEKMKDAKNSLTVFNNTKVTKIESPRVGATNWEEDWVKLELEDGRKIKTKLLIGADGVNSFVRNAMNIKYIKWNYNQRAIVATLKLSEPCENNVAWQRFLSTGPVALLPLTDTHSSLVWSATSPMAHKLMKTSDEEFVNELNMKLWDESEKNRTVESVLSFVNGAMSTFCPAKGNLRQLPPSIAEVEEGSRACFPLGFGHASEYAVPRIVLIGDAAHRIHPLAGQGVNLGFGDVRCLTEVLSECISVGGDIGCLSTLQEYERLRQRHIMPTMAAIEGLHRLYSTNLMPVVLLRSVGLLLTDGLGPIKERIIAHASL